MQHSFFQKVFLTILSGLAAACLVYFYRHWIAESFYEMGAGFNDSHKQQQHSP